MSNVKAIFSARLNYLLKQRGMSQATLAEKVGVSTSTVSSWITKTSFPRPEVLGIIAKELGVTLRDLVGDDVSTAFAVHRPTNAIPYERLPVVRVLGTVRCGPGGLAVEDFQGWETADVPNPEEYFYLRCTGDSMAPRIQEGDLALVHQQDDVESGELAVVVLDGEEGMLKKVIKQNGTVVLQSLNPSYPPIILTGEALDGVKVVGRVKRVVSVW